MIGRKKKVVGRQHKDWTGLEFGKSVRAVEDRIGMSHFGETSTPTRLRE